MLDLEKYIRENFEFLNSKKMLLALSGGIDSIVLVDVFSKIFNKENLAIANANFKLRSDESDKDSLFAKSFANKLDIEFYSKEFQTENYANENGISIEMAARELRYDWFNDILKNLHFDYVVVAHHNDDNLETFLLNLVRGTGISGLRAMKEINENILRPFLKLSRQNIEDYARKNNLKWREDSTNNSEKYKRNKIRHSVVPVLKELNPSLLEGFQKTLYKLKKHEDIYIDLFKKFKQDVLNQRIESEIRIDIEKLKSYVSYELLLSDLLKEFSFNNSDDILSALDSQPGKEFFSSNYRMVKDRNFLILKPIYLDIDINKYVINLDSKTIKAPIELKIEKIETQLISDITNKEIEIFDLKKLSGQITIRRWREGDYFYPTGMIGKKKLSKYFKDEKMSLFDKEKQWILCSGDSVVWVIGRRADRRFIASGESKYLVKIRIIENDFI